MRKTCLHLFLIIITGFIIYQNILNTPFYYDDNYNIVENYKLRDLNNFWPPSGSRWFGFLTFAINYYIGGLNTFGYHIVNLIIHILNAILVYWLVALIFKTPYFGESQFGESVNRKTHSPIHLFTHSPIHSPRRVACGDPVTHSPSFIALLSALLFVSHPIQTQAVTYIVQRFTSLATMFYLFSVVMYINFRLWVIGNRSEVKSPPHHLLPVTYYLLSIFSAILAMKTKEIAFTLPFIIILYEFCFFSESPDYPLLPTRYKHLTRLLYLLPFLLILLVIPLERAGIERFAGDVTGALKETSQETEYISRSSYLFTQFRVIVTYLRLLFIPINQNLLYDYPVFNSLLNPQVFLSMIFLLTIFGFGIYLFKVSVIGVSEHTQKTDTDTVHRFTDLPIHRFTYFRLTAFGIFWFFITLSVESSIIPIKHVIFEHRIYLPSIGAIIAFTAAIFYVLKFVVYSSQFTVHSSRFLLVTVIIVLSIATYQRNVIWKDEASLWEDVVKKSPYRIEPHNNLGKVYAERGLLDQAIQEFKTTLKLNPEDAEAHSDLGSAYGEQGRLDEAIQEFKIALRLNPDYANAHNNLGLVYYKQGRLDDAFREYVVALRLKPDFANVHNNIGNIYYKRGLWDDAIKEYRTTLFLNPDHKEAQYNLSMLYTMKKAINGQMK